MLELDSSSACKPLGTDQPEVRPLTLLAPQYSMPTVQFRDSPWRANTALCCAIYGGSSIYRQVYLSRQKTYLSTVKHRECGLLSQTCQYWGSSFGGTGLGLDGKSPFLDNFWGVLRPWKVPMDPSVLLLGQLIEVWDETVSWPGQLYQPCPSV
jgi:hypothetical protein